MNGHLPLREPLRPKDVDITNCDREPIHLLGYVQPFGFLLALSEDWTIVHASESTQALLGKAASSLIGQQLSQVLLGDAIHTIKNRLQMIRTQDVVERIFAIPILDGGKLFDVAVHLSNDKVIIEAEPSDTSDELDAGNFVRTTLSRLHQSRDLESFLREAARHIRLLNGFDRVMIYKFAEDGAGEVVAEAVRAGLPPYLGLHYPASDIPKQARILYKRNLLRIITDINSTPSPIYPILDTQQQPLDLSMSVLRAVSNIHIEYLQNMGVGASMSISIIVGGELWGLFACHHMSARHISFERRTAAELYGQVFSLILETRLREQVVESENRARSMHDKLMSLFADDQQPSKHIRDFVADFKDSIPSDGVAIVLEDQITLKGITPREEEIRPLVLFLNERVKGKVYATCHLGHDYIPAQDYPDRAAGILAVPISRSPRDYILFFRREVARTVTWGGDPTKPASLGPNGIRLTPRKSFEAWAETVRGQSEPWQSVDCRIGESIRITLLEVVLRLTESAQKERKEAQERQSLLIAELNHRVKNILSLIRGVITQSRRADTVQDFIDTVGGRIEALSRAHDQLTAENWAATPLRALLTAEASAYLGDKTSRVILDGPNIVLEPQAFTTLALVVHEMMTNAVKYGSLADNSGQLKILWSLDDGGNLVIGWEESGGPPVKAPQRKGFGSLLVERSIPYDLKGDAKITYHVTGVKALFTIPAGFVRGSHKTSSKGRAAPVAAAESEIYLTGRALVLEDNMLIALDAEEMLIQLGAVRVETASSVKAAKEYAETKLPDFAILDVNLGSETSIPFALYLKHKDVPFVFATGYGESIELPDELKGTPIVRKPYSVDTLKPAMAQALQGR
ncbi:MAG: HWE histidine kinase domain-containing protein [Pseudomonadota bacterium]